MFAAGGLGSVQIAGFNILECADVDEALEVASKKPGAAFGMLELRDDSSAIVPILLESQSSRRASARTASQRPRERRASIGSGSRN